MLSRLRYAVTSGKRNDTRLFVNAYSQSIGALEGASSFDGDGTLRCAGWCACFSADADQHGKSGRSDHFSFDICLAEGEFTVVSHRHNGRDRNGDHAVSAFDRTVAVVYFRAEDLICLQIADAPCSPQDISDGLVSADFVELQIFQTAFVDAGFRCSDDGVDVSCDFGNGRGWAGVGDDMTDIVVASVEMCGIHETVGMSVIFVGVVVALVSMGMFVIVVIMAMIVAFVRVVVPMTVMGMSSMRMLVTQNQCSNLDLFSDSCDGSAGSLRIFL